MQRPFLHPQSEDTPSRFEADPLLGTELRCVSVPVRSLVVYDLFGHRIVGLSFKRIVTIFLEFRTIALFVLLIMCNSNAFWWGDSCILPFTQISHSAFRRVRKIVKSGY